ncbi:MAG TPA: hypothetical protein PK141_03575 [Polyangiaceae bacterium]|nr:hypothetical protein [Polyangiaceae bacterium]
MSRAPNAASSGLLAAVAVAIAACAASSPSPSVPGEAGTSPDGSTPVPGPTGSVPPGPVAGSAGCAKPSAAPGGQGRTLTVGGGSRSYSLFVPDDYAPTKAYSLVFAFHGDGGTGAALQRSMKLDAVSAGGALVVYPDGVGKTWNLDTAPEQNPDVALFDGLVAELEASYCVDTKRVFATGYSRGGYFANQLGCWRGAALRAIASSGSGGPFGKQYDATGHLVCPQRGVPTIIFHGTNDSPSEGQKSLDHWAWANECPDKNKQTDTAPSPCKSVSGCAASKPVVWCLIPGMGHQIWSESDAATWAFFAKL